MYVIVFMMNNLNLPNTKLFLFDMFFSSSSSLSRTLQTILRLKAYLLPYAKTENCVVLLPCLMFHNMYIIFCNLNDTKRGYVYV